ncbi:hypothetical protein C2L80_07970 [Rubneribacter badeniensis]|uniref:Uncharacterized protein n=1 Tax=Rubneribacter badeniensis TaxID=2070688 RepID=A0A2K2U4C7_9ACTN|nr:hypothetical protein [Rubneribacter badeniensis]OUO96108.1 hypothetical protein B5F41_03200 [Gordonibacter sp. An232A]PNV65176.1 hypothetical protein C2L80_07970 [Rubneribacter badeniensis]HJH43691.1 hypothetical protein [Rubneribacter badeniensis]
MIYQQLENALAQLQEARTRYEFELEGMPDGKLVHVKAADGERYYVEVRDGERPSRRGITRRPDLVATFARKEYLRKALAVIDHDVRTLERAVRRYKRFDPEEVVGSLSSAYRDLPLDAFYHPLVDTVALSLDATDEQRIASHAAWGAEAPGPSDYLPEGRTLRTSRGERMRSKAEVLIAETLYSYGIPFRYEQELEAGGATFHPDFTFEGAGGKEFYLEFCGMMDDPAYVEGHKRKRSAYEAAGIAEWDNIIYLYASGNSTDMMYVDSVVRTLVVPKL